MELTLAELAARVGGEVEGDGAVPLRGVRGLAEARAGHLAFYANRKYRAQLEATQASAVILGPGEKGPAGKALLRHGNPYLAFAKASWLFHPAKPVEPGVAPQAFVHPTAEVHPTAQVMPLAYVGPRARVGARTVLHPLVHVGEEAAVGEECVVYPNVTIRERCRVGDRVILNPGVVIGSDGFGFAFDLEGEGGSGPRHFKVPQAGTVRVEDDVELGANTAVDRATLGATVIGRGTKIDNLVQIAHNVEVGPLCLLVAQAAIAGSSRLGTGVILAGQVGVVGHVEIGDGARIGAQSGVSGDVEPGAILSGSPAFDHREWLRASAAYPRLADLVKQVRALEKKVAALEGKEPK